MNIPDFSATPKGDQAEQIFACNVAGADDALQFIAALVTHRVDNSDFYQALISQGFERSQVEAMARYGVELEIAWASTDYAEGKQMRQWCGIKDEFAVSRADWLRVMMEAPDD